MGSRVLMAVALISVSGCTCNRNAGLANTFGDVVIVVPTAASDVLTREGSISVPPVVMLGHGASTVTLRNVGANTATLTHLSQRSGSQAFTLELPDPLVIESQGEATLAVTFSPPQADDATQATVEHEARFEIDASGTRDGEGVLTLELLGNAVARDCLVPATLDFGVVALTQQNTAALHLTNDSQLPQTPTIGVPEGDDAAFFTQAGMAPEAIAAGASADLAYRFAPTSERDFQAQVSVQRSASCPVGHTVLKGTGSNDNVDFTPKSLDFGRLPLTGERSIRQVTFTNRTAAAVHLTNLTVTGVGFSQLASPATVTLDALSSLAISVICTPTMLGTLQGALTLEVDTVPVHSIRVPLLCVGGGPRIRLSPTPSLEFGTVPYLTSSSSLPSTRRVSVSNVGTPPANATDVSSNLFLGQNGVPPFIFVHPENSQTSAREFQVSLLSWDSTKGLPAIAGQNSVDLDVHFTPSSTGPKKATLTVYSNDAITPAATITIDANAVAASLCTLSLEPTSVSFGDLPPGSALSRTVTLTNTSANDCWLSGLEMAPGSDPMFSVVGAANRTLVAHTSAALELRVTVPAGSVEGTRPTGFARFSVNSASTPQVLIPVGVRVSPCLVTTPADLEFGTVMQGCKSASKSVTLYNACSNDILVTSVALETAPSDFRITAAPAIPPAGLVLPPGSPQPVQVAYVPTVLAPATGAMVISVLEAGVPKTVRVPLTGVGSTDSINIDTFTQPAQTPADILFIVDNSCSMFDEQASLASNFSSFIAYANQLKVPYQIGVTTTDDSPLGAQGRLLRSPTNPMVLTPSTPNVAQKFSEKVNVGTNGSGIEQPLSAALKAVTDPLISTDNQGFLRPGASLSIIVVSDAPDQSNAPSSYYQARFMSLVSRQQAWLFTFSTIGPFAVPTPAGCSIDSVVDPDRYAPIIAATNGVQADICTKDWATDLDKIGRNALGPRSVVYLTSAPDLTKPVTVTVNGTTVTAYTVDPVSNAIVFQNVTSTPPGSTITVKYETTCY